VFYESGDCGLTDKIFQGVINYENALFCDCENNERIGSGIILDSKLFDVD
jgi:hypothetical protein